MQFCFGEFEMDAELRLLRHRGRMVRVQAKVMDLLLYLAAHADRVVTRDELFAAIWPDAVVTEGALARAVQKARRALADDGATQELIRTVHGRGFRFVPEVAAAGRANGSSVAAPGRIAGESERPPQLTDALDEALTGRGGVVLHAGPAELDGTTAGRALEARAAAAGARRRVVRCLDDAGAPPLWPWVQLLRHELEELGEEGLRARAGASADLVAPLLPELGVERGLDTTPSPGESFDVFDGVTRLLLRLAEEAPRFVQLDRLHHADASSLALLRFLAPEVRRARVLVVATYREGVLRQDAARLKAVGELAREPSVRLLRAPRR